MFGVVAQVRKDGKAIAISFEDPCKFNEGQRVTVSKEKSKRTIQQNAFYWCFLTWCIHKAGGALCDQGHFSVDALHEDIKAWFKDKHKHDFDIDKHFSTTELNTAEFSRYFDIVDKELMIGFFEIDTSGFHEAYEKYGKRVGYGSYNFRDYMDEQLPF